MITRVQHRDRPWSDAYVSVLCGPIAMPSTDALRAAVGAIVRDYPHSRLTWRLDSAAWQWHDDRPLESVVVERDWPGDDVGSALDAMAGDAALTSPLCLIRYPNHIGLRMLHCVGDGRLFLTTISTVLQSALTGEVVEWPVQRARSSPLLGAAAKTFGGRPRLLRDAVRDRVALTPDAPVGPGEQRPWTPARRTIYGSLARSRADELFDWGAQFAPKASRFALLIALMLRAMRRVGLETSDDRRVLVDLRRYLGWRYIDGNFVAGVPMRIDAEMAPEELSASMRITMSSARPLANQLLTSARSRFATPIPVTSFDPNGLARVTFTNMGRTPEIDGLPFLTDLPPVYGGSVPPDGPFGLTVLFGDNRRMISINVAFNDNVIDADLVQRAVDAAIADPIGLVSESPLPSRSGGPT
jgi:hypothetical protein